MFAAEADVSVETLSVDVVSDVVCPWCYIGKRKVEAALADTLIERLFRGYFVDGRFIGDRDELVRIASQAGYPAAEVRGALASDEGLAATQAEDREARNAGINGVPFFIFNGRTAVSGAHHPDTLLEAIAAARNAT